MQYSSGNVYEGEWQDDLRHGQGTMHWNSLGQRYTGMWQNGYPEGKGVYEWKVGASESAPLCTFNRYDGEFARGKRNGFGIFHYANGALYKGLWQDNKKHGHGRYVSCTGKVFEGLWNQDRPQNEDFLKAESSEFLYHFPISQLLPPNSSLKVHQRAVNHVIQRYQVFIKQLYSAYSKIARLTPWPKSASSGAQVSQDYRMELWQFWELLKDCGALQRGFTVANLDRRIFSPLIGFFVANSPAPVSTCTFPLHNQTQKLSFYEFLALLINLSACFCWPATEPVLESSLELQPKKTNDVGLGNCLAQLLENCLTPAYDRMSNVNAGMNDKVYVECGVSSDRYVPMIELLETASPLSKTKHALFGTKSTKSALPSRPVTASIQVTPATGVVESLEGQAAFALKSGRVMSNRSLIASTSPNTSATSNAHSGAKPARGYASRPSSSTAAQLLNSVSQLTAASSLNKEPARVSLSNFEKEGSDSSGVNSSAIVSLGGCPQERLPKSGGQAESSVDAVIWGYIVRLVRSAYSESNLDRLTDVYGKLSRSWNLLPKEQGQAYSDKTVTVRSLVLFLQNCGLLDSKSSLALQRVVEYFKRLSPAISSEGALNMESELVLSEFFDAIVAFSIFKSERKILFVVRPLLKHIAEPASAGGPTLGMLLERDLDDFMDDRQRNAWIVTKIHSYIYSGSSGPLGELGAILEAELISDLPSPGLSGIANVGAAVAGSKSGATNKAKLERLNSASKSTLSPLAGGSGVQPNGQSSVLGLDTKRSNTLNANSKAAGITPSSPDRAATKSVKGATASTVASGAVAGKNQTASKEKAGSAVPAGARRTAGLTPGAAPNGSNLVPTTAGNGSLNSASIDGVAAAYALSNIDISTALESPIVTNAELLLKSTQDKVHEQVCNFIEVVYRSSLNL